MTAEADPVTALEEGRAFVNLSSWWKVGVRGGDAGGWLNDLLTAELDGIGPGEMRSSLLLTPTGKIRAAVGVILRDDGYLLLQDPIQPTRIDAFLDPYVLSSDVHLSDRTEELELVAIPGGGSTSDAAHSSPSVIGLEADLIGPRGSPLASESLIEAGLEDVEAWRVRRGVARFGIDLTSDSLPHEVELGDAIAYGKGCFLGQESVARVRNLGRPPFVLLAADAPGEVEQGDLVTADDGEAGIVTSAAPSASVGTAVIARIRWALKDASLLTSSGVELRARGLASA
jgi:folate-binding protein YgfZ